MCKVKRRRFKRAKKSKKSRDWERYVTHKKATASALKAARWDHLNGILQTSLEEKNTKPFHRYIKAQKNDNFGVSSLKFNVLYCIMRPYTDGPIGPLSYRHSSGVVRNPHSTLAE